GRLMCKRRHNVNTSTLFVDGTSCQIANRVFVRADYRDPDPVVMSVKELASMQIRKENMYL
ncbi:hypothetical protein BDR03DRAFT_952453, partial [Suillus americanus]